MTVSGPKALVHGRGSLLVDVDGRQWIDLISGFGAVFLGHAYPSTVSALQAQAAKLWACGRLPTPDDAVVDELIAPWLPTGLRTSAVLSTGMEAAELALRVAATHTGRGEFIGLARSMHGKSAMTAALCWENAPLTAAAMHTLPFVDTIDEDALLELLRLRLASQRIAALFIEPIQGSNAGHAASHRFYNEAARLCREQGSLLIADEILTGLWRTGDPFFSSTLDAPPDLLLFAKSMGNGFPVSALATTAAVRVLPQSLPGSTFAGNPLAMAAVRSTLLTMAELPMQALVHAISETVAARFAGLRDEGLTLRGRGALWCLELDARHDKVAVADALSASGVLVSMVGRSIRLLPAATMPLALLDTACERVLEACRGGRSRP